MKVDRDMMALLKATKKAARPPQEALERIQKLVASRRRTADDAATELDQGSDIAN
jgi:hypothetical protein